VSLFSKCVAMARDLCGSILMEAKIFIESIGNYLAYPWDGGEWIWIHSKDFKKYKAINGNIYGSILSLSWISNLTRFGGSNLSISIDFQTWRKYRSLSMIS